MAAQLAGPLCAHAPSEVNAGACTAAFLLVAQWLHGSNMSRKRRRIVTYQADAPLWEALDPRLPGDVKTLRSPILSLKMSAELMLWLPFTYKYNKWRLLYSPDVDGASLATFYRQQRGANLLVVEDAEGSVFGAYCDEGWRPSLQRFGSRCGFVFRFRCGRSAESEDVSERLQIFHYEGLNPQWAEPCTFGVGKVLLVDETMVWGTSVASEWHNTTDSLSDMGENFVIRRLECWSLVNDEEDGLPLNTFLRGSHRAT